MHHTCGALFALVGALFEKVHHIRCSVTKVHQHWTMRATVHVCDLTYGALVQCGVHHNWYSFNTSCAVGTMRWARQRGRGWATGTIRGSVTKAHQNCTMINGVVLATCTPTRHCAFCATTGRHFMGSAGSVRFASQLVFI